MQDTWYSDPRDLLKWGTLIHLARREGLGVIVQVAMFRPGARLTIATAAGSVPLPEVVWDHFRDFRDICTLGVAAGIEVIVIDEIFDAKGRAAYFNRVAEMVCRVSGAKAVLLDPDTGFEPGRSGPTHVESGDVKTTWNAIGPGDWLVLYQHARHDKRWRDETKARFAEACAASSECEVFRASGRPEDVALLGVRKTGSFTRKG